MDWQELRRYLTKRNILIFILVILLIIMVFMFTNLLLFANMLIGNDIVVSLTANKESIVLEGVSNSSVVFTSSVSTNPFCSAKCIAHFEDLSNGTRVFVSEFELRSGFPREEEFLLSSDGRILESSLYRYSISCHSKKGGLCFTTESATERKILLPVEKTLSNEEITLRQKLLNESNELIAHAHKAKSELTTIKNNIELITQNGLNISTDERQLTQQTERILVKINKSFKVFIEQDTENYQELIRQNTIEMDGLRGLLSSKLDQIEAKVIKYNLFIDKMHLAYDQISTLKESPYRSFEDKLDLDDIIDVHENTLEIVNDSGDVDKNYRIADSLLKRINPLYEQYLIHKANKTIRVRVGNFLDLSIICFLGSSCEEQNNNILDDLMNLSLACSNQEEYSQKKQNISLAAKQRISDLGINLTQKDFIEAYELITDIEMVAFLALNSSIDKGSTYYYLVEDLFLNLSFTNLSNVSNNTELIARSLLGGIDRETCKGFLVNSSEGDRGLSYFDKVKLNITEDLSVMPIYNITLPKPMCCYEGECYECCLNESCRNDVSLSPLVFVHGHWFSKDTNAEYSLDSFNSLAAALEIDGFLDAGAVSLYTSKNFSKGVLGKHHVPLMFRASYYFDMFHRPDNYVPLQSKSERIDVYAIRLKDLIDNIVKKTGYSKVRIVAHSMGGLVTRRYIHLFGLDNVERIVLIGTPNKGIEGNIAEYCPILGAQLECEDMHKDSAFMSKLNEEELPWPPIITNIMIGGCDMDGEQGDGIVLTKNQKLDLAVNIQFNGTCDGLELAHIDILDPKKSPEAYQMIKKSLIR